MAKILTLADLPDDLVEMWLTHLRAFDRANEGRSHFRIIAKIDKSTTEEVADMLQKVDLSILGIADIKKTH